MNEIGFMAIKGHENEVVKTLFNKEFDYKYNLDYMFEENNSFFLTSISSRNYEAMQHLTSSYSLNYHVDVSKQIQFLKTIPHFKEIYPKLTLTKKIEEELKKCGLFKEYETLTMFKNLDESLDNINKVVTKKMKL